MDRELNKRRSRKSYIVFTITTVLVCLFSKAPVVFAQDEIECLDCHDQSRYKPKTEDEVPPPFISANVVAQSTHGRNGVACVHCHTEADEVPHPADMKSYTCEDCHKTITRKYANTIHGKAQVSGFREAATCVDCHGSHDILERSNPRSKTYPSNVDSTCLKCHTNEEMARRFNFTRHDIEADYEQSVHGRLVAAGHEDAATCNDCHGSHEILPSRDPNSWVNRNNIPKTCGQCHWIALNEFEESVHGRTFLEGSEDAPVCNNCHSDHKVAPAQSERFKLSIVSGCGNCHEHLLETYRFGYHGKVSELGGVSTARCSDCHGWHKIYEVEDPRSKVASGNLVATCRKCHPYSNEKFVQFMPHLEVRDKTHPVTYYSWLFMTCLLLGTISFFILHTILWLIRESVLYVQWKRSGAFHELHSDRVFIRRFSPSQRITHAVMFISVIGLAVTGLPLRYSEARWAHWIFNHIGGHRGAGGAHRFFASLTVIYVAFHFAFLHKWWKGPKKSIWQTIFGPNSMVPNWTDIKQFFQHVRWFLFLGPHPRFGRWTYWEKFDYMAVFWGLMIIGSSGLILAILPISSQYLPGWVFNVALIIHSDEALLASSFLFLIHFFHVHLRPLKFPMDPVVFTGRMTQKEMEWDRAAELDQIAAEGRLAELAEDPPTRRELVVYRLIGFTALAIGLALAVCIMWAEYHHLFG